MDEVTVIGCTLRDEASDPTGLSGTSRSACARRPGRDAPRHEPAPGDLLRDPVVLSVSACLRGCRSPLAVPHWGPRAVETVLHKVTNDYSSAGRTQAPACHVWPMVATSPTTVPDARTLLHGGSLGTPELQRGAAHDRERQRNHDGQRSARGKAEQLQTCYGLSEAGTMLPSWRQATSARARSQSDSYGLGMGRAAA
jgi:hypothetical protein